MTNSNIVSLGRTLNERDVLYLNHLLTTQTHPLTKENLSKKHIRILAALHSAQDPETTGLTYVNLTLLCSEVVKLTLKNYPRGDIVSFAEDLALRGYIIITEDPDFGTVYAILETGTTLLVEVYMNAPSYLEISSSPNYLGLAQ